jgi:HPt (histidine-containing phosphotransfer) domain-containing protein
LTTKSANGSEKLPPEQALRKALAGGDTDALVRLAKQLGGSATLTYFRLKIDRLERRREGRLRETASSRSLSGSLSE